MGVLIYHLLGYNPSNINQLKARKLELNDPRVVARYLTSLHSAFKDQDLFHKMSLLHSQKVYPLSEHLITEYETMDTEGRKITEEVKDNGRIMHTGKISRSLAYKKYA